MRLNRRRMNNRIVRAVVAAVAFVFFVTAFIAFEPVSKRISRLAGETGGMLTDTIDMEQSIRLKVVYPSEGLFMEHYGNAFRLRYPNVSFEVVTAVSGDNYDSTMEPGAAKKMLKRDQPDVLLVNQVSFAYLATNGQLAALDDWIVRDRFDLQAIDTKVTDRLKQLGGGVLYGLAPEVEQMGLFYNRELFGSRNVPFPVNRMSWDDVLQTAARFPAEGVEDEKRIYGLSLYPRSTPGSLFALIAATMDLRMIDPVSRGLTLQAAGWRDVWSAVIGGYKTGYVLWEKQRERDLFLDGRVAMTLQPFLFVSKLKEEGSAGLEWDVVTEPVNPGSPDLSATFRIPTIYAVHARSSSASAAWELVKFINSYETAAKKLSDGRNIPLLSRKEQLTEHLRSMGTNANIDCFYELKPAVRDVPKDGLPAAFRSVFADMVDQEAEEVMKGSTTAAEALQSMERRGGEALHQSRNVQPGR